MTSINEWASDEVLRGPKSPCWGCTCGENNNWACRIVCRGCGREAPERIRTRARKEHKKYVVPSFAKGRQLRGSWAYGSPQQTSTKLEKENKELKEKIKSLEAKDIISNDEADLDATDLTSDAQPKADKIKIIFDAMVAAYGAESAEAKEYASKLQDARNQERSGKPVSAQLRPMERRVWRRRKALEKSESELERSQVEFEKMQKKMDDLRDQVRQAKQKLQEDEDELQELVRKNATATSNNDDDLGKSAEKRELEALSTALQGDEDATWMLELLRQKASGKLNLITTSDNLETASEFSKADAEMDFDAEEAREFDDIFSEAVGNADESKPGAALSGDLADLKRKLREHATGMVRKRIKKKYGRK